MSPSRIRLWIVTAVALTGALVAGCLPPPSTASNETPSAPSGSAAASARPSATPKPQDVAIAAFAKLVAGGKLTYRVSFKGDVRASVAYAPVAGAIDVSGGDFASSITYDFEPRYGLGKVRVMVRGVGRKGWIMRGSAAWQPIKSYGPAQSYVPFKTVKAATDVRYVGTVKVGGRTYYKIGVSDAVLIHPNTIPYQVQKEKIEESVLEVLIDEAGRPRSGTWTLNAQARIGSGGGQLQRVVYDLKLTFSKVGAKISVRKP
jgi:hypothetical protein